MPNKKGQCTRCFTTNPADFAKKAYYCRKCTTELRQERLEREADDPMAEENRFQRQLLRSYRRVT